MSPNILSLNMFPSKNSSSFFSARETGGKYYFLIPHSTRVILASPKFLAIIDKALQKYIVLFTYNIQLQNMSP